MTMDHTATPEPLVTLSSHGVAVWLDDLSRERLDTGNLSDLVSTRAVVGVTSNPTIFEKAITKSDTYTEAIVDLARSGASADQAVRRLTVDDVRRACDLLGPVAEQTRTDGRVSLEVDPRLAHDTGATIAEAHDLWHDVGRTNLFIKIPATRAGLPAITRCIADGISVNVTLIFSLQRYQEVIEAYLSGLEQRLAAGASLHGVESVASFFVSRVDTEADQRLSIIGTDSAHALRGRAAIANARLAYQAYESCMASERWLRLQAQGARCQRPLWASTSVKNPDYDPTMYVTELVAPDTVNTMPEETLEAVAALPGITGGSITGNYDDAEQVFHALDRVGVDMDDVTAVLEEQGVEKFAVSWNDLLAAVDSQLAAHR